MTRAETNILNQCFRLTCSAYTAYSSRYEFDNFKTPVGIMAVIEDPNEFYVPMCMLYEVITFLKQKPDYTGTVVFPLPLANTTVEGTLRQAFFKMMKYRHLVKYNDLLGSKFIIMRDKVPLFMLLAKVERTEPLQYSIKQLDMCFNTCVLTHNQPINNLLLRQYLEFAKNRRTDNSSEWFDQTKLAHNYIAKENIVISDTLNQWIVKPKLKKYSL